MTKLRWAFILIYAVSLAIPLWTMLNRTSDASQAILGRYSPTYAAILFLYLAWCLCWWFIALGEIRFKRFQSWVYAIIRHEAVLIFLIFAVMLHHLSIVLLFSVWELPTSAMAAMMLNFVLCPFAISTIAPTRIRGNFQRNAPVLIASVSIMLILMEILVRITIPYGVKATGIWLDTGETVDWRKYVGWAAPKNAFYYHILPGSFLNAVQTNSHGLHDTEYTYEKPENTFRILILGDSFTYAAEVPLEDSYQQVLEKRLNEVSSQKIEVIAGGIGGWSNDQHLLYLENEGCRYQPDLVLLQFAPNDPDGNINKDLPKPHYTLDENGELVRHNFPFEQKSNLSKDNGALLLSPVLVNSRLALLLWGITQNVAGEYTATAEDSTIEMNTTPAQIIQKGPESWRETYWRLTPALIAAINEASQACDAPLIGIALPVYIEESYLDVPEGSGQIYHFLSELFYETLDDLNIAHPPIETLRQPFVAYLANNSYDSLIWKGDGHYTANGNHLVGNVLADWIIGQQLIPIPN